MIHLTILLGIKTVLNFNVVPNPFLNCLKNLEVNFAQPSDMMDNEMPLRHIISYRKILAKSLVEY